MEKIPQEPSPEELEEQIGVLLTQLYERHAGAERFEEIGPEMMEEWYLVEMEAEVGKDRQAAKEKLATFLQKLDRLAS